MNDNYSRLKDFFEQNYISIFGVADMAAYRGDVDSSVKEIAVELKYGISFAYRLSSHIIKSLVDKPNLLYAFHYARVNKLLDVTSLRLGAWLQQKGYGAVPIPASQVVNFKDMTAHLSHREVAYWAGIGWYGRNNLMVHPEHGPAIRFATVLTDMPLPVGEPLADGCGACQACVMVCPAGAIHTSTLDFERDKCNIKLKEFAREPGIAHSICGLCIKACRGGKSPHPVASRHPSP